METLDPRRTADPALPRSAPATGRATMGERRLFRLFAAVPLVFLLILAGYAWLGGPGTVHSACAKAGVLAMMRRRSIRSISSTAGRPGRELAAETFAAVRGRAHGSG